MIKRYISVILVIFIVVMLACCDNDSSVEMPLPEEPKPHDFMDADWGMSKAKVKKILLPEVEIYAEEDLMLYEIDKGYDVFDVFYYFSDDAFCKGECRIEMGTEVWSKRVPEMIKSYVEFRNELISIYGQPLDDQYRIWLDRDPLYINDDDMHNLYYKRMEYVSLWETGTSSMSLKLYYKDRDFKFVYEVVPKESE